MNASQSDKLAMYHAVHAFLSQMETSAVPALPPKLALFGDQIRKIIALANTQALPTSGRVLERDFAIAEMIDSALAVAGPALSYAESNKLGDLAAKVRLRRSHFNLLRKVQRTQLAQRLYEAVLPHANELASFGVTPAMLAELQSRIEAANTAIPTPRGVAVTKKTATAELAAAFKTADELLSTQIDSMLLALHKSDPTTHARYQAARRIAYRAGGRADSQIETASDSPPAVVVPSIGTQKVA